ncbi:MAG TPA: hypothetical protein VHQ90_09330 [Thermoanaerobaculia bacterium]|nr:hypothetical protein [Thermoanaerobaculia bacterium]
MPSPIRIFVSSPGDVAEERALLRQVLRRLQGELAGRGVVEPVYWEHEPLLATASFQEQIQRPAECDVAISILWARLGTRLPASIKRPDGSPYASGTEFEFEDAAESFRVRGRPNLLVYRKTAEPQVSLRDERALLERLAQKKALDGFIEHWFHGEGGATLTAAFHVFANLAEFETLVEIHLRKLLDRLLPARCAAGDAPPQVRWQGGSPFRGLAVFEPEHAGIFFGRTRAIAEVLASLRRQAAEGRAFVLVLGMSGCGKSSLVRAGVLPMLMQTGVIEGVGLWRRAILRPSDAGGDLFVGLAATMLRDGGLPELAAAGTEAAELAQVLREAPKAAAALLKTGLGQAAARVAAEQGLARPPMAMLALVVDQLEEIFTLERVTAVERAAFVAALDALARSGRVWVVATLRSDFYPRTAELPALAALKEGAGQYDLLPATPAEIGQMIRQPALAAGLGFGVDPATEERLDDVLRDTAAQDPASLPLLEFTLEELYQERTEYGALTFEAYRRLGGVEGALARRAEQVFQGLPEAVEAALPAVLRSLVTLTSAGEETVGRKRAQLEALASSPEASALVDAFVSARLFVAELAADGSAVVEVAHEALLRHWPRLSRWLEEDRENLRVQARVAAQAALWDQKGRSADYLLAPGKPLAEAADLLAKRGSALVDVERRLIAASLARERSRRRRRHLVMASLAVLALLASVSAVLATSARRDADRRRVQAQDLIAFMLGELTEKLEPLGRLDILGSACDKVLSYFRAFEAKMDRADLLQQVAALNNVSTVRQGEGKSKEAVAAARQALALSEKMAQRDPADAEARQELADSHNVLGQLDSNRGDLDAALKHYQASTAALEGLIAKDPRRTKWQVLAAAAHGNLAPVLLAKRDLTQALVEYRRALAIYRGLAAADPGRGRWQNNVASEYLGIGSVLQAQGDLAGARQAFQSSLDVSQRLVAKNPADAASQNLVASSHRYLGVVAETGERLQEAAEHYRAALHTFSGLAAQDPSDTDVARDVANAHEALAHLLARNGDSRAALLHARSGTGIIRNLLRKDPTRREWRPVLGRLYRDSGGLLLASGDARGALRDLQQAVAVFEPDGRQFPGNLAESYLLLGEALAAQGRRGEAQEAWTRAAALLGPIARGSRSAMALDLWVRALLHLGRSDDAAPALRRLAEMGYHPTKPFPLPGR